MDKDKASRLELIIKGLFDIKDLSSKIFLAVLVMGCVSIFATLFIGSGTRSVRTYYKDIKSKQVETQGYMYRINALIFQHQAVMNSLDMVQNEYAFERYDKFTDELITSLNDYIEKLGSNLNTPEGKALYAQMRENVESYLQNSEKIFELHGTEGTDETRSYTYKVMFEDADKADKSIEKMLNIISEFSAQTQQEMEKKLNILYGATAVCFLIIVFSLLVCCYYCVRLALNSEKNKLELEQKVNEKTVALQEKIDRLNDIQNKTVTAMANLIENRDGDTGEHIKRTSAYVQLIAEAAKAAGYKTDILTDDYIHLLSNVAPMHDIGKITIEDSILKKPGKLTDEEFEKIKTHAPEGGRIIKEVLGGIESDEYIAAVYDVAAYHHEKWNGKGYPCGLKGEEIPLAARIMAIADVFDALVSKRCYKEAISCEDAFEIIEKSAGSHFDPTLARVFLDNKQGVMAITR